MMKSKRAAQLLAKVSTLGLVVLLVATHLADDYPRWALGLALLGALLWLLSAGGSALMEP